MGLFGFIGKAYSGLVTGAGNLILGGIEKITGKTYGRITAEEFREDPFGKALTTAATATTLGLGIVTLPVTAPVIVKAAIAKPITALVVGGLVTTVGGRALIEQAATGIYKGGRELGLLAEKAAEEGREITAKEALKAAGLLGAGLVLGAGIPEVIEKVKEFKEKIPDVPSIAAAPEEIIVTEKPIGIEGEVPILPEVTTIPVGERPYKRRRAKITPPVKQYVKVNIINRATSTGIRQSL